MHVTELTERLVEIGFVPRAYSGRNMYRQHCVATVIPCLRDLALLGKELHAGLEIDNYAFEFIAYWPTARIYANDELLEGRGD